MSRDCPPHRLDGGTCIDCGFDEDEIREQRVDELERRVDQLWLQLELARRAIDVLCSYAPADVRARVRALGPLT